MVHVECNAEGPRRTVIVLTSEDEDITLSALVRALNHFISAVSPKQPDTIFKGLPEN